MRALHIMGKLVAWLYQRLFAKADLRAAIRFSYQLRRDIENDWSSLLRLRRGTYRPLEVEKIYPAFDYGTATFEFDHFNVEVTRGRGEIGTRVSGKPFLDSWIELSSLLNATDEEQSYRVRYGSDLAEPGARDSAESTVFNESCLGNSSTKSMIRGERKTARRGGGPCRFGVVLGPKTTIKESL
jgi:hypothetical protein